MTTIHRQRIGAAVHWTARLWSLPLIAATFLLATGPFFAGPMQNSTLFMPLGTLSAMACAVALVVAWRWEGIGGWLALVSGVAFAAVFTLKLGRLAVGTAEFLFWGAAILFLVSFYLHAPGLQPEAPESAAGDKPAAPTVLHRLLSLPASNLAWCALLLGAGFFVFMRLFWMQAYSPGRDRSTFFSDPINAACLICAFVSPIIAMFLALVAIIWKRERSLFLIPLLLLGLFALLWSLAVVSGANA